MKRLIIVCPWLNPNFPNSLPCPLRKHPNPNGGTPPMRNYSITRVDLLGESPNVDFTLAPMIVLQAAELPPDLSRIPYIVLQWCMAHHRIGERYYHTPPPTRFDEVVDTQFLVEIINA